MAVFEAALKMSFAASVSVVVSGEWMLDVMEEVLVLREMRGLREAFVGASVSWEGLRE